ncbi:MAG: glutathione S-transferase family protein [Rhizobiaceae bacterium]
MYTLIGSPKTRAFRVLWMLRELGLEYDLKPAAPQSEPAREHNPSGKVPVLITGNDVLLDSVAITQFLADKHEKFTNPAGTVERARQDSFTQFAVDEMEGPCWNFAKHSFILPKEFRTQEAKPAFRHDFDKALGVLETRLGDRAFVMGDEFTVPDLVIGHIAGWAKNCKFEWPKGAVGDYFERLRSRPAFLEAWEIREAC